MFGKAFLVAPVTESDVNEWNVYLPKSIAWYDFWTGDKHGGGQMITKETPIEIIPLYVKAGSILSIGPRVEYATEKNWDTLEIRIYPGADGEFTLYEDENDNYNYEKGTYSTITFTWDDTKKNLTISDRKGSFIGLFSERIFRIIKVSSDNGIGTDTAKTYDKVITYNGNKITIGL